MQKGQKPSLYLVAATIAGLLALIYMEYRSFRKGQEPEQRRVEEKRNVYIITASGLRQDHLSSYLYQSIQTPAMDYLAYDGIRFLSGWTPSPDSLEAHLSLLSGIYPFRKPVAPLLDFYSLKTAQRPPQTGFSMPEWFRRKGYITAAFLSDPILRHPSLFTGMFQEFYSGDQLLASWQPSYKTESVCRLALDWIERNSGRSHLLLLNLAEPMPPYHPPSPFDQHYMSHPYDGEIAGLDEQIGLFVNRLKSVGLFEKSILVFAAPYALAPGEKPLASPFEDGLLRIPIFIVAPGLLPRHKEYAAPASLIDIFPTILSLLERDPAGLKFDGIPLFQKGSSNEVVRDFLLGGTQFSQAMGLPPLQYGRSPKWKWITGGAKDHVTTDRGSEVETEVALPTINAMKQELKKLGAPAVVPLKQPAAEPPVEQLELAFEALREGDSASAFALLQETEKLPSTPYLLLLQSELAAQDGQLELALNLAQAAYRKGSSPFALAAQARVRLQALQYREAKDLMDKYVKSVLNQSYYDHHTMGLILRGLGDARAATEEFGKSLLGNPRFAPAFLERGRCYNMLGEPEPALADFRAAVQLEQSNPEAERELVALLLTGPNPQDASPFLRRLLKQDPRDFHSMLQLARLHAASGDPAEATRLCNEIITQSDDPQLVDEAKQIIAEEK